MRLLVSLALVAAAAAGGGRASNCTRDILGTCSPRFQWKSEFGGDCSCFLLDLGEGKLWVDDGACGADIEDYNFTSAELYAWLPEQTSAESWTITDNALAFETDEECGGRRAGETQTVAVQFLYSSSKKEPVFCPEGCNLKLKLYTDYVDCVPEPGVQIYDNDDVAGSWKRGTSSNGGSGRRGTKNSNSRTSGGNDRRQGGACVNPLFASKGNLGPDASICQLGQCCGSDFCHRDQSRRSCADNAAPGLAGWKVGHFCDDSTCKPTYGGQDDQSGKGGAAVTIQSSLDSAEGALEEGGKLDIKTIDVGADGNGLPVIEGPQGDFLIAFSVTREFANGTVDSGYLPQGKFITVFLQSPLLDGRDIIVWRVDDGEVVDSTVDCEQIGVNGEITVDNTVSPPRYTVPICHTSTFTTTFASDGDDKDDKDDKKDAKGKKAGKKAKVDTKSKTKLSAKEVKKDAKKGKGKAEIAIGVGVAGGAVALAGVGFILRRRQNNKKGSKAPAPTKAPEIATVSV